MPQIESSDVTIVNERTLPATPGQIFDAFQQADKLARWWGPDGFTNTFNQFDFTHGGRWDFIMHGPDGTDYHNEMIFREVKPDTCIVVEHIVQPWFLLTIDLVPKGDQTHLTWQQKFESPETAAAVRERCNTANEQVLDRLQAVLAE